MNQQEQIENYRKNHPDQVHAFYWSNKDLADLQQAGTNGVRIHLGQDEEGNLTAYANATVDGADYTPESLTGSGSGGGKGGLPCPTYC